MDIGTFRGITALLVLFCFLGIVFWAYSKRRKKDFDEAKNLPFADEEDDNKPDAVSSASRDEADAAAPQQARSRQDHSRNDKGDNNS